MEGELERKVLLVDDDLLFLKAVQLFLSKTMDVEVASSGEEALRLLQTERFPVIVSDMHMPGISGVEFLVRAREVLADSIFLLLTADRQKATAISALNEAGVYCIINKPCGMQDVADFVEAAFKKFARQQATD